MVVRPTSDKNISNLRQRQQGFLRSIARAASFDAGALGGGNQTSFVDLFEADGGRLIASSSAVLTANNNLGSTFRHFTLAFTAASGITRVAFRVDPFTDSVDGILDNVSVSAVPEPAAWALMLFGFILVGGAMRRRAPMTAVAA